MTDIEAGAAEDTFALVDLIGNTYIDAAFGAEQGASAAGNTSVGNEIELFYILSIHTIPPVR